MHRLWILGAVFGLSLTGCGSGHVGSYEGRQSIGDPASPLAPMVGLIKLELKSGGRFSYQRMSMPWEGSWTVEDGVIVLRVDSALGKKATFGESPGGDLIKLTPQKDGSLKLEDPYVPPGESVLLRKPAS